MDSSIMNSLNVEVRSEFKDDATFLQDTFQAMAVKEYSPATKGKGEEFRSRKEESEMVSLKKTTEVPGEKSQLSGIISFLTEKYSRTDPSDDTESNPSTRIVVRDASSDEAPLVMEVVSESNPRFQEEKKDERQPSGAVVRYSQGTAYSSNSEGHNEIQCDSETVARLKSALETNRAYLDKNWLESEEKKSPSMRISFLTPEIEESCPCCGKKAALLCTRCRQQRYCSRDCQKAHWTGGHKQQCKSIDGRVILVDIAEDTAPQPVMVSPPVGFLTQTAPLGVFPLKIQVAIGNEMAPMMCYDENRSFNCLIHLQNCRKAKLLDRTVREQGEAGGAKAYYNATVRGDGKLAIYLDQRLENRGW